MLERIIGGIKDAPLKTRGVCANKHSRGIHKGSSRRDKGPTSNSGREWRKSPPTRFTRTHPLLMIDWCQYFLLFDRHNKCSQIVINFMFRIFDITFLLETEAILLDLQQSSYLLQQERGNLDMARLLRTLFFGLFESPFHGWCHWGLVPKPLRYFHKDNVLRSLRGTGWGADDHRR